MVRPGAADCRNRPLYETAPMHVPNGDEPRYADKRFAKTLLHNEAGEVDVEAFKIFISIISRGGANGFVNIPRDQSAEVGLNDHKQGTPSIWLAAIAPPPPLTRLRRLS